MKKISIMLLLLVLSLCTVMFFACDETSSTPQKTKKTAQYELVYANTNMQSLSVDKGDSVSTPSEPEKDGYIFAGWYLDASFTEEVVFPIVMNADTTIYAKYYSYETAFTDARENTIGESVQGYEYDYTNTVSAQVGVLKLSGNTTGNAKYSQTGEVSFYDSHVNSGALFYDGSKYQIRRNNLLQKVSLNEEGEMKSYSVEEVDSSYKFDSSSFAKALFEYTNDSIKNITKTNVKNEYKLNTQFNTSSAISLLSKGLNNKYVLKVIKGVPSNNVNTGIYVAFSDGKINTYRYEMKISVSAITFSLTYNLQFKNIDKPINIIPQSFGEVKLSTQEITNAKNEIDTIINNYKAQTNSSYDFTTKTGVDFGILNNEINATFDGKALRKVDGSTVYFHNDIEIDTDYKNNDLYKADGISDVHIKRTKLANGDVYNIKKSILKDTTAIINDYNNDSVDDYYLFDMLANAGDFTFATTTANGSEKNYTFGLSQNSVAALLSWFNNSMELDPLYLTTSKATIFGSFDASSILIDEAKIVVKTNDSQLVSIDLIIKGDFSTKYEGSRDFASLDQAAFDIKNKIKITTDGNSFVPYTDVKDAK